MNIKIVGKNIELGESFQAYSSDKIGDVLQKYGYDAVSTQITLEKRLGNFKAKLKVYLKNKIDRLPKSICNVRKICDTILFSCVTFVLAVAHRSHLSQLWQRAIFSLIINEKIRILI